MREEHFLSSWLRADKEGEAEEAKEMGRKRKEEQTCVCLHCCPSLLGHVFVVRVSVEEMECGSVCEVSDCVPSFCPKTRLRLFDFLYDPVSSSVLGSNLTGRRTFRFLESVTLMLQ